MTECRYVLKFSFRESLFPVFIFDIKLFDARFFLISKCVVTCEEKEITKTCGSFMIVTMTGQYVICGHNEISHYKISFIFTIHNIIKRYTIREDMKHYVWIRHNLWVQRILWLQNLFRFRYLQDDQTIHNLWGLNRTLEDIMLHAFNKSTFLKIKRTFVKLIDC